MSSKYAKLITAIGAILAALTCLLFFTIGGEKTTVQWASFFFILFAQGAFTGGSIYISKKEKNSDMGKMAAISRSIVLLVYTILSVLVSLVFITGWFKSMTALINIQAVILALCAIIFILIKMVTKDSN